MQHPWVVHCMLQRSVARNMHTPVFACEHSGPTNWSASVEVPQMHPSRVRTSVDVLMEYLSY